MKIAMYGHKQIPSRAGGVEVVVEELGVRMVERGHQVTCWNRGGKGPDILRQYHGIRLRRAPTVSIRGLSAVVSSFFAAMACCISDADVVHIHAEGPGATCFLPRLFGKHVIVTVHGLDWQREKWRHGFGRRYIRWGEKMVVRFAHEIIVLNRDQQRYFREKYGRETVYIPNGASLPVKRKPMRITECYGLQPEEYILYLGRLVPEKGVHCLIEAYQNAGIPPKLVIAGTSSDTEVYVRQLKKLAGRDPRIIFAGFVDGEIREELYSNAWIYVLPSELEGMPLSLLEAMSHGNCCVVSDIPACAEVVGDCGFCFPRGNGEALAALLKQLYPDTGCVQRMRQRARDHVLATYSWENTVESTLALYRRKGGRNNEDPDGE